MPTQELRPFNSVKNSFAALGLGYLSTLALFLLMLLLGWVAGSLKNPNNILLPVFGVLYRALMFPMGDGRHIVRGVLVDSVVLGSVWLLILWLRSKRRRQAAGPVPGSTTRRFNWWATGFVSLCVGLAITIGVFAIGRVSGAKYLRLIDFLIWPGVVLGAPFGGIHGQGGIPAIIIGNAVAYGAVCFLILWLKHRRAEKRIGPEPDSSSVTELHL